MSIRMSDVTRLVSSLFLAGLLVCLSSFALAQPSNVPDLTGEWRIVGNNYTGELVVSEQAGARFSGTVYSERMVDGIIAGNTVSFTRMWDSKKLRQDFTGELTVGADGKGTITGTFTQNLQGNYQWTATSVAPLRRASSSSALAQPSNVPDLTGEWRIVGNNYTGELVVSEQADARFSGTVYSERMVDGIIAGNTVSFTRMWDSKKLRQDFTGELTVGADGKGTITGTFTQNLQGNYQWTATSVAPLRRASSTTAPPAAPRPSVSPGRTLPVDVSGSWSFKGDRNQIGRVHIWQNGQHFTVVTSWPSTDEDHKVGIWKSYKGEGTFQGRQMVFKVMPSNRDGRSVDEGYVYHWTISDDNSRITGYYTRHGKTTTDHKFDYNKVK